MDPLQVSALNALAPFLALATAATSPRAAANVISQATSSPSTYVFAELLQTPNMQSLKTADPQHKAWLKVLELFSWGMWSEYRATPDLPKLNEVQTKKLRLLTILTLAREPSNLTYPALRTHLELNNSAELEALLTEAIYAGLVTAKLNPLKQRVEVASVAPLRDLEPGSVQNLEQIMGQWEDKCAQILLDLEGKITTVKNDAKQRAINQKEWDEKYEAVVSEASKKREGEALEPSGEGKKTTRLGGLGRKMNG